MDDDDYGWYKELFLKYPNITYEQVVEKSEQHYNFQSLTKKQQFHDILSRIGNFGTFKKWDFYEQDINLLERDYKDIIAIHMGLYYARARLYMKQGKYEQALEDYLLLEKKEKEHIKKNIDKVNSELGKKYPSINSMRHTVICLAILQRNDELEERLKILDNYFKDKLEATKKDDPTLAIYVEQEQQYLLDKLKKVKQGEKIDL